MLPWWAAIVFAVAGAFYFNYFIEIIFVGIIIDSLYGSGVGSFGVHYAFTLISSILLLVISNLKTRLIMYT